MNAKKKCSSTKAQIKAEKERQRRIGTIIFAALILIATLFSVYFGYQILSTSSPSKGETALPEPTLQFKPENPNPLLKAAIVDHLSLTVPNQTFVQTAATILTKANFTVDYFSGEKVTVNFYKNLPTGGYKLIILRVHSALGVNDEPPLALFTSELLDSRKHVNEQLSGQVQGVMFTPYRPGDKAYFGVVPKFIESCVEGNFQNSVIIAMGCDSLRYTDMAQAFIEKGAKAYMGWKGSVSASHTDTATISLLQHLITEKQTIKQAIDSTMKEVGTDPTYKSQLAYYPLEAGGQTIESIKGGS